MSFKENDFIEIDYTAYDAGDNSVLSTTSEQKAKEANIYDEKSHYGPTLVVLGSHAIIQGLERELMNMNVGEEKTFTFEPKDAFGERLPELVGVVPLSQFKENKIDPKPGMQLNMDNSIATVRSVEGGRVIVDRNHPDAGKSIKYEVKVIKQLNTDKEKIEELMDTYEVKPSKIEIEGDKVKAYYDPNFKKNADYFVGKANALAAAFTYMPNIKDIDVIEEYENKGENVVKESESNNENETDKESNN